MPTPPRCRRSRQTHCPASPAAATTWFTTSRTCMMPNSGRGATDVQHGPVAETPAVCWHTLDRRFGDRSRMLALERVDRVCDLCRHWGAIYCGRGGRLSIVAGHPPRVNHVRGLEPQHLTRLSDPAIRPKRYRELGRRFTFPVD